MGEMIPETKKFLFGLISVDGYLEPPIPLNPCRICGGTERYLTHTKIFGISRWLIYCVPCELGTEPKRYPHQACIAWNNKELYNRNRERIEMNYSFTIPTEENTWHYDLLRDKDCQAIICEGTVVMYIWKEHNHKYCFEAFFYKSKNIISKQTLGTKKELYETIQKLLQKELYGARQ